MRLEKGFHAAVKGLDFLKVVFENIFIGYKLKLINNLSFKKNHDFLVERKLYGLSLNSIG